MRAAATARLRLRVGSYEHRRSPQLFEHFAAALRGADEKPRRLIVHATIIATATASAAAVVLFGA